MRSVEPDTRRDGGAATAPPAPSRLRRAARAAGRALAVVRGLFPVTVTGLLVLALSAIALWFVGVGRMDMVLLAAGFVGATVFALLLVLVLFASLLTHLRCKKSSTRPGLALECDTRQDTGFRLPFPRFLPCLEYSWTWVDPGHVEVCPEESRTGRSEVILPRRRGWFSSVRRRISVRDALGLCQVSWTAIEKADVRFLPSRGALDQMNLLEGLAGGDDLSDPGGTPEGDRVDMRQYVQGDSPRMILWKVYARSRKLLVRVPERAIMAKPRSCGYLVAGEGDEAGAGMMRVILERGFLGENWRFGADGSPEPAGILHEALEILVRSGSFPPDGQTGIQTFLQQAEKDGYSACLLVLPPVDGPWSKCVAAALAATTLRMHVYTVVDRVAVEKAEDSALKRVFLKADADGSPSARELARMARNFTGRSLQFLLVDRQAGKVFGDPRALTVRLAGKGARR